MNILISGIGGPTPIGIAKSLRRSPFFSNMRIVGVDGSKYAPGLYNKELFDETYLIPHSSDENYWEVIESIVNKEVIDYSFIVPELEVLKWSEKQAQNNLPCGSLIPDLKIARALYDKFETANKLKLTGLVPKTVRIVVSELNESLGENLGYPFWVRGGSGAGAIGSYKITDLGELQNWVKINSHINDFLASEYLPGKNYACKVLCYEGNVIRAASAERIGYLLSNAAPSGISGMCSHGRLVNNDQLIVKSINALQIIFESFGLSPHGMFTLDFKGDRYGEPKITEINIRHVSFTLAFSLCGANFAEDSLRLFANDQSFERSFKSHLFKDDYTFIRGVDSEIFVIKDLEFKTLFCTSD